MAAALSAVLSLSNPVFACLVFCSSALVLKMFFLAAYTSLARFIYNAFVNPEDAASHKMIFGADEKKEGKTVLKNSDQVERIRRNHLNDLENIPVFILIGLLYTLSEPAAATAILHFRVFTIARFTHMFCYQFAIPQPSRALCFMVGLGITASMAVQMMMKAGF